METSKIITDFTRLSDPALEVKAQAIVAAMTGNTNFTTPAPTLAVVNAAISTYSTALSAALTRDRTSVATKNDARFALINTLLDLGSYVTFTAQGDKTKLISSGFTLAKDRLPAPEITKPEGIDASNGVNSGEVFLSVFAVPNAKSYVHQFTADPVTAVSNWTSTPSTKCKHTFGELQSGAKLWFRIAAVGSKGQIAYSDALSKIVQ
jgi:hypothetical protein